MWQDDASGLLDQRMVCGDVGLAIDDIQSGTKDLFGLEGFGEGIGINNGALP